MPTVYQWIKYQAPFKVDEPLSQILQQKRSTRQTTHDKLEWLKMVGGRK